MAQVQTARSWPEGLDERAALEFWDIVDQRFANNPDNVNIFHGVLLGYTQDRFNAVQLYSLVYALFRVTDTFDLLADFIKFMPTNWQNANLSNLHRDIAFALKDPELWNDFLIRTGLQTKDGLPVEPPFLHQASKTARNSPILNGRQCTPVTNHSLLEHVMGFDGSQSMLSTLVKGNDDLKFPSPRPVTPTHSPPYLSTSSWRGGVLMGGIRYEKPPFPFGNTPEEEEWYRKRNRQRFLEQSTPIKDEKNDHDPIIGPAAANVQAIITALNTKDARGLSIAASQKKDTSRRRPELSIEVPSNVDASQKSIARPIFSPLTPAPGVEKSRLLSKTRELSTADKKSALEGTASSPLLPRDHMGASKEPSRTSKEKFTQETASSPPSQATAAMWSGKARRTNNSLASSLSHIAGAPEALPDTLVPMKPVYGKSGDKRTPGQRTSEANKRSRQLPSASEISYVGPIYATERGVLLRDFRPYIHAVCGMRFRHPADTKTHHTGRNGKRGCTGKGEKQHLAWNAHRSCITMSEINWRRVQEGYVILDQESMDKVNAAIAAGSEGLVDVTKSKEGDGAGEAGQSAEHDGVIQEEKQDSEPKDCEPASKKIKV